MHEPVIGHLEEYLNGGEPLADVEEHLRQCAECRKEMAAMQTQSALFRSLRASEEIELSGGFYARVMNRIETQVKPSAWSLFGESLFAKRLGYALGVCLVLLGSVLVQSSEPEEPLETLAPERILAGIPQAVPVSVEERQDDRQRDRDAILVNLTTYQDFQ